MITVMRTKSKDKTAPAVPPRYIRFSALPAGYELDYCGPPTPIRSRVAPDVNPLNGGIVDSSQAGMTCPDDVGAPPVPAVPRLANRRRSFANLRSLLRRRSS